MPREHPLWVLAKAMIAWSNKNQGVLTIFSIFISLYLIIQVQDVKIQSFTPNLALLPSVSSGSWCNYPTGQSDENAYNNIIVTCDNSGDLNIEAQIIHKGGDAVIGAQLKVKILEAVFDSYADTNQTKSAVHISVDDSSFYQSHITPHDSGYLLYGEIPFLKANDKKLIKFQFPADFGIFVRPKYVLFTLSDNGGKPLITKIIQVNYETRGRERCNLSKPSIPYILTGDLIFSDVNKLNVSISVKNLQTTEEMQAVVDKDVGAYILGLGNEDSCYANGDVLEVKSCINKKCAVEGYTIVNINDGVSHFNVNLTGQLSKS